MTVEVLQKIKESLIEGEADLTVELTRQALSEGIEPLAVIEQGLIPGMDVVGQKYAEGEYFLPNLVISATGMKAAMQLLEPVLRQKQQSVRSAGTVVIGTVRGDIHEIGKSLVATMLSVNGFQVHDLGADVPVETFIAKVKETGANLLGLSALLTTTMTVQKDVIRALDDAGLRQRVKVIVGGAPVNANWASEIGADGYAEDAMQAVSLARQLCS